MEKSSLTDEQLLESFFADAHSAQPDDGFTDRVMAAIETIDVQQTAAAAETAPASAALSVAPTLSVARFGLRGLYVVAAIIAAGLLLRAGYDLFVFIANIHLSDALVGLMLGIHRLRDAIAPPTPSQLVSPAIALVVLMTLTIQRCSTLIHNLER